MNFLSIFTPVIDQVSTLILAVSNKPSKLNIRWFSPVAPTPRVLAEIYNYVRFISSITSPRMSNNIQSYTTEDVSILIVSISKTLAFINES